MLCKLEYTDFLWCRPHRWRSTTKRHRQIDWRPECWSSCGGTQSRSLHSGSALGGLWVSSGIIHHHLQRGINVYLLRAGEGRVHLGKRFHANTESQAVGLEALTHGVADCRELPVLFCTHILAVTCFEGHSLSSPLNVEHCVYLSDGGRHEWEERFRRKAFLLMPWKGMQELNI